MTVEDAVCAAMVAVDGQGHDNRAVVTHAAASLKRAGCHACEWQLTTEWLRQLFRRRKL